MTASTRQRQGTDVSPADPARVDALLASLSVERLRAFVRLQAADWAHSRFPGHALTPTGVMAIRCKQFHLPDL